MHHTGLSKPDITLGFLLATAYSSLSLYAVKALELFQGSLRCLSWTPNYKFPGETERFGIFLSIH